MCAFSVSGQPPTIIFCVQGATRAADRTPHQRRGMEQRPEAHGQATLAAVGRIRTVAGGKSMPGRPNPRLNHLFSLRANGEDLLANSAIHSRYGRRALIGIRCAARHPQQQGKREIGASR
jgi:hypothetical protein